MPVLRSVPAPPSVAGAASRLHRIWPAAGLALAAVINAAWIGFLGFEFYKLIKPAFF